MNPYYYGLLRRFDKRARLLLRLGFAYRSVTVGRWESDPHPTHIALFVRRRLFRTDVIPAHAVMGADKRYWQALLEQCLHRPQKGEGHGTQTQRCQRAKNGS